MDADRRARLLGGVLRALVQHRVGSDLSTEATPMGRGVGLVHDGVAWVLVDDRHQSALGPAVAWSLRQGAASLQVLTPEWAGLLARRAAGIRRDRLSVDVWQVQDRHLTPAMVEPLPAEPQPEAAHVALAATIAAAGAEVVVEHGVVAGEVAGLEVCRVVSDPDTGAVRLAVGVGAHDREAFGLLHGERAPAEALAEVVTSVAWHRRRGAEPHPLNRLARERLLRHRLIERPDTLGLVELQPVAPPLPRPNLKDPVPCTARGIDPSGQSVLVVCSPGLDLDVVPYALDVRAAHHPTATVTIAVYERDAHPVQYRLAELATGDLRLAVVPDDH